jgi:uncharacterized membrane protein (UPF0136 family)
MMHISRKTHGILDYVFSVLFAASPWLFGFSDQPMAVELATISGVATALYSAVTNYEMGLIGLIPFSGHRFFDFLMALVVGGSMWHFNMKAPASIVFGILGVLFAFANILTRRPREMGTVAR